MRDEVEDANRSDMGEEKADVAQGLIGVLRDEDDILRLYALKSLGELGHRSETVTQAVVRMLSDSDVSSQAAITLEELAE